MTTALLNFFRMGGYGFYVWCAYGSLFAFLLSQWYFPWRRWQKYLREQQIKP
jgi:heme exporter protein CcmD